MQQHYDLLPLELVSYRNTAEDYEKDNKCLLSLAAESKRFLQDTNVQMTNTGSDDNNIYIVNKPSNSDDKKSMPIIDSSPVLEKISLGKHLLSMWYLAVILLTPIVFLPVFLLVSEQYQRQARCGYTIAVMAIYWTTEALPIAVTSLAPVVLLPALGVLTAKEVSSVYFNDTTMLFVGGMVAAAAVETWNVHKRIALLVLKLVGAEPKCLLLGICLVTWFLSMWISNTATTAMMIAIVQALLAQFKEMKAHDKTQHVKLNESSVRAQDKTDQEADAEFVRLSKALTLSVAYSANIGGVASLTGTGPNLVLLAASQK
uniref:Uncharacterized protein n=1 Tax=Biomphalaria glabrata TaxID=6526 RepID=A0A2C9JGT3_BIOGL